MSIHTTALPFTDQLEPTENFTLHEHIIEDRGSRYSVSIDKVLGREDIKTFLTTLKKPKAYKKATHHSYAARILHGGAVYETKSDDGETGAGMVILRIMQKQNVVNAVICVTRWFGGIKLEGDRFKHIQDATIYVINTLKK
jgi:putative IMPACT (imprinted ancient) family translation regulator